MRLTLSLIILVLTTSVSMGQLLVTDPVFPTPDNSVVVTFNSALGSGGLAGYTGDMYAHTGVITSNSTSGTDWKYVKAGWNENIPECKMISLGDDLWQLTIEPSIKDYYGVPDGETILQLAFVFRSEDGSQTGKTDDGGDIFYDVYESGINVVITLPDVSPYIVSLNDVIEIEGSSSGADSTYVYDNGTEIYANTGDEFATSVTAQSMGKHWIVAKAVSETEEAYDSVYYYVKGETVVEELPEGIRDGINYIDGSTVVLCLLAPEKENVFVIGDFNDWQLDAEYEMKITPDGLRFWVEIVNLEPGQEYIFQYLIDGAIRVGDPYTEKVSDPWNDQWISNSTYPGLISYPAGKTYGIASVLQTNQPEYEWQIEEFTTPSAEKLVIYELLVRDFVGNHDYQTLIDTLDYLERLGINAIELMPNSEFEGNSSWGYNPNYYFAVDKYYGPKNDFKMFVDECHSRGIAVFMDLVLNHAYGTNPMAMMYWNAELNRPAENNPWFNETSNFLNPDAQWGNDFNHESLYTQALVDSINRYWMREYKVDGFRFDFTKGFGNNVKGDNDPWGSNYDADRIALLKRMADKIWEFNPDAAVIFEHLSVNTEEKVLADYGILMWGNLNYNYNEATMGYNDNSNFEWISYKERGWNNPHVVGYMESHDEERLMFKNLEYGASSGDYSVKDLTTALHRQELAANFFFPIPGPKMIWQFGERGYDVSIDYNGRLGEKPPRWEYMDDYRRLNLFYVYSALIDLKKNEEAFSTSTFNLYLDGEMKKIKLTHDDMNVIILGNFGLEQGEINPLFHSEGSWYEYWTGDTLEVTNTSEPIDLQPGEYRMYTNVKLNKPAFVGVDEVTGDAVNITVYPNPASDYVYINSTSEIIDISVFNLLGGKVYEKSYRGVSRSVIDITSYQPGYYFVMIESPSGEIVTKKVVVR